jgi:flagellar hook-basal body complex protein FliE
MEEFYSRGQTILPESAGTTATASAMPSLDSGNEASFSRLLSDSIHILNTTQKEADRAIAEAVAGRTKNLHETMLIMEKADLTYKLAMQVRNKIIDAYREIMKMQI